VESRCADLERVARYKLLTGLVYPRPIALVSTVNANGVLNAAPFSFFNMVADEPPLAMLSFNRHGDGTMKDTVKNIRRTGEFVVNLVDETIANGMVSAGQELPETESEFAVARFAPMAPVAVAPPRYCTTRQRFDLPGPLPE
jgi:flavin reductase (DIM6/NTAB) family NADH-FMN oxidoreductase RutF